MEHALVGEPAGPQTRIRLRFAAIDLEQGGPVLLGLVEAIGAGVFLTGGTSLMRGFSELAFEVFGRDIYRPELPAISGIEASFKDPRYATSIGLIRYAQILETERAEPPGLIGRIGRMFWPFGR